MKNVVIDTLRYMAGCPFPRICRHLVALNMLNKMEEENPTLKDNPNFVRLVKAFSASSAGDEEAIEILKDTSCLEA